MTVELHDRISMGCTRAFYLATKDFDVFEIHGEKITAYRNGTLTLPVSGAQLPTDFMTILRNPTDR
jgi:hypothetical protein